MACTLSHATLVIPQFISYVLSKTLPVMSKLKAKKPNKIQAVFFYAAPCKKDKNKIKRCTTAPQTFSQWKEKHNERLSQNHESGKLTCTTKSVLTHPSTICSSQFVGESFHKKHPHSPKTYTATPSPTHLPQHIHTYSLRVRRIIKVNGDSPDLRAQKIGWNHLDFIIPFTLPPDHKVVLRACFMYSAAFPPSTSMWSRLNKPSSGAQLQQ